MYRCIIGRSSQSGKSLLKASKDNLRFDNRVVSRNHAELFVDVIKKEIHIKDLYSLHGTLLNDIKLTSGLKLVSSGDTVVLGATVNRGEDSYKPVKIRISYTWNDPSEAIPSCELPATNTYTVPDDEEGSEAQSENGGSHILDAEHDPSFQCQTTPLQPKSGADIISIKSSPDPAERETDISSTRACRDSATGPWYSRAPYPGGERPVGPWPYIHSHSTGRPTVDKIPDINDQCHVPFLGKQPLTFPEIHNQFRRQLPPLNTYALPLELAPARVHPSRNSLTKENLDKLAEKATTKQVGPIPSSPTSSHACGTKRKFDDLCAAEAIDGEILPDAQPQKNLPGNDTTEEIEYNPPQKRAKSSNAEQPSRLGVFARYAATAITGAVLGGVGTVVALASLPPGYFD
ncbi:hypothetical protein H112_06123 [Trichophyton rubrum D6]|nr:hypothetical protein H100_06138 [Trichophyton rubrum MR850]EZF39792.1 hypothetical protein H102_06106 [Trichophyton rubrum CBS 100081]EZF50421.1 hypothetical protein H103_06131 [Trichophyton rubrum CBS 288.86]EZF61013.1 hypothetical protein H104_06118 [Trichophyton rubrum CBS 289.86]EZF82483.1 hypothetical protein H110_06126 [Trichophyton rubrum MR1448]EZG14629.1 hypothetical protein H107_06270 [Trichophyton rubrum CBS 202.88]KDB31560.1 hypothetical protein H112_06123 [Trichophyton rubrum 